MLGHNSILVDSSKVFQCASATVTPITGEFLDYLCSYISRRHPSILVLREVVGDGSFLDFLHIFAGMEISVPSDHKKLVTRTLLPEVMDFLGGDRMGSFVTFFAGEKLRVIPHKLFLTSLRDTDIYLQVSQRKAVSNSTADIITKLGNHYSMNTADVRWIYRKAEKFFGEPLL